MKRDNLIAMLAPTRCTPIIHLWTLSGEGPTAQAAFDAALTGTGVAHCDRLRESSLIAPHTGIVLAEPRAAPTGQRARRCVVMSQMQQSRSGHAAHAGIGWVQRRDDGSGLFIDLHDDDSGRLEHDLRAAFAAIPCLRDAAHGPVQIALAPRLCTGLPVCALVVAAFSAQACDLYGSDMTAEGQVFADRVGGNAL
jgi:arginine decarboxylase